MTAIVVEVDSAIEFVVGGAVVVGASLVGVGGVVGASVVGASVVGVVVGGAVVVGASLVGVVVDGTATEGLLVGVDGDGLVVLGLLAGGFVDPEPPHALRASETEATKRGQARSDAWMSTMRDLREIQARGARCPPLPCGPGMSFCLSLVADESMTAGDVQEHDRGRFLAPPFTGRIASSRTSGTASSHTTSPSRTTR